MEEGGEISTDNKDYILEEPFIVLATQNPLEYQGTFPPLPEAQLDRFLMKISLGYPDENFEREILKNYQNINPGNLKAVANREDILNMQEKVENTTVHEDIIKYIINISNKTRDSKDIQLGASPRASIDLLKAAKAKAFLENRNYVIPDDVKEMVIPVLNHRIILSPEARIERKTTNAVLEELLQSIFIPVI